MTHALRSAKPCDPAFDIAVVIPTIMRPELERAVRSVFAQDYPGRVQILIGIDVCAGPEGLAERIEAACPAHMAITWFDPGFSTSQAHGGVHPNAFGGAIRTVLSHLANAERIAYLDDDNWWAAHHLSELSRAIDGHKWAFSLRWFVNPESAQVVTVDDFESIGPDRGIYARLGGGFVDTSSLMLDREACTGWFHEWAVPMFPDGTGEDRRILRTLQKIGPPGETGQPSVYYTLNPDAGAHPHREAVFAARGISVPLAVRHRPSSRIGIARLIEDYLVDCEAPRLRIGWHINPRDGWLNGDFAAATDKVIPLPDTGHLPFAASAFTEISLEALEHLEFVHARNMLTETARILRPGGRLYVRGLDLYRLLELHLPQDMAADAQAYLAWAASTLAPEIKGATPVILLNALYRRHEIRFLFSETLLRNLLAQAGFIGIARTAAPEPAPQSYPMLALEALRA